MGWIIPGIFGLLIIKLIYDKKRRRKMLAAMSPEERKRFLALEEIEKARQRQQKEEDALRRQIVQDEKAAASAKAQIAVAQAEGRTYARVWVPEKDVSSVQRWAGRQSYTALKVKEGNRSTDVQISVSGFPQSKNKGCK